MMTLPPPRPTPDHLYWLERGTTVESMRALSRRGRRELAASDIRAAWDYRSAGLTVAAARAAISAHLHRTGRDLGRVTYPEPRGRILSLIGERRRQAAQAALRWDCYADSAVSPDQWLSTSLSWDHSTLVVRAYDGLLVTHRREDATWTQGRHYPTTTTTTYRTEVLPPRREYVALCSPATLAYAQPVPLPGVTHACRGDWRGRVVSDLGLLSSDYGSLPARLSRACELGPAHTVGRLSVRRRLLLGHPVDYVATDGHTHYHAASVREAVSGLSRKIALSTARATGDTLSVDIAAERWGFCRQGCRQFAVLVGLDPEREYMRSEVRAALTDAARDTYHRELQTAGLL